jgi:nucleotide-binding universal stress UspA family protein
MEWRCAEGEVAELVMLHARYADLAIIGQRSEHTGSVSDYYPSIAEEVVLGAGRPVLVVPYIGSPATVGKRVLVAWNGSREAARALNDALPILERAEHVTVLVIDADGAGRTPGADIAAHLARHGVRAEASHVPSGGIGIGDALLSRAADLACDLIVMGAYGHSRVREFVMGGASRHMFDHMTVPVLMAH